MVRALTQEEFLQKVKAIHGDKYDYSHTHYIKHSKIIKIYCKKCKKYFEQTANSHLAGKGCPICGRKRAKPPALTIEQFIKKAIKIHGDEYDYSKVKYINNHTKVEIYCKKCKRFFMQTPNAHLNGNKCKYCMPERMRIQNAKTKECFIEQALAIHKNRYDYAEVIYKNAKSKIKIFCNTCKKYFLQTPAHHLLGCGCPNCCSSKGELMVENFLIASHINYQREVRFKNCKDKKTLPFDFYLPDYNICIEFQGKQHYIAVEHFDKHGGFDIRLKHDQIKREYCKNNGIKLLEITYKDNIEKVLTEWYNSIEVD